MNRQGPNKIDWTDYTWNPVTGCKTGCSYCYARAIAKRFGDDFTPKFHPERLDEPARLRKPSKIFVGSMGDIMDGDFRNAQIGAILQVAYDCPHHTFQFLTRHSERYADFTWPDNCWLGATTTSDSGVFMARCALSETPAAVRFLSCEPWFGFGSVAKYELNGIGWVIVGAMTGPNQHPPDEDMRIASLVEACDRAGVPVFCKRSIHHICDRQEWPKGVRGES